MHLRNGRYVPDHRDNFLFGKSSIMTLEESLDDLRQAIEQADALVGHSIQSDHKYLAKFGINLNGSSKSTRPVFDTQRLYRHVFHEKNPPKLEKLVRLLNITPKCMHNAGNDAFFTMKAFTGLLTLPSNHLV
jgi:DNA polymerase III alpha subunit (gram-positive type)